jgi:hypothetical protein
MGSFFVTKTLYFPSCGSISEVTVNGPVDQSGMIAAFARRKPRVQIPPGPLNFPATSVRNQIPLFEPNKIGFDSKLKLKKGTSWKS